MIPRYSRPELAALWDDKYRFELWLTIELAACRAMERSGTVPEGTARLRLSFSVAHPDAEITRLADIVRTRILCNA